MDTAKYNDKEVTQLINRKLEQKSRRNNPGSRFHSRLGVFPPPFSW
jgi:hypothetical protein